MLYSLKEPTKPLIKSDKKLKQLSWNRILVGQNSLKGTFWKDIKQLENINFKKIDEEFSVKLNKPIAPARKANLKSASFQKKSNLDEKKAKNIEIFFRSTGITFKKVEKILNSLDLKDNYVDVVSIISDNVLLFSFLRI